MAANSAVSYSIIEMKPYGREKKVSQNPSWKRDYHIREKGRKVENWWEGVCACLTRSAIKRNVKREIDKELEQ